MAGYSGFSKSNNALDAEDEGLMTATAAAKALGVSAAAIKEILYPSEWHHTSGWYNRTNYYNISDLSEEKLSALKAYKADNSVYEYQADVEWIEWSGSRRHPKANKFSAENILVTEKGCFYTFHLPNRTVRKKIDSNGTRVNRIWKKENYNAQTD